MSVLNITVTSGSSASQAIADGAAASNDQALLIIYQNGVPVLAKSTTNLGGSGLVINSGTNRTLNLSAAETALLPASGLTYVMTVNGSVAFTGSVTVNSASAANAKLLNAMPDFALSNLFSANGPTDYPVPAGNVVLGFFIENLTSTSVVVNVGSAASGTDLISALTVAGNAQIFAVPAPAGAFKYYSADNLIYLSSSSWSTAQIRVTTIYQKVKFF